MLAISYKQVLLGIFLGVFFFIAFLVYEANAIVIDNSGEIIRDSDILETTIRFNQAEIKYIGNWKDTIGIDEINKNYERSGNTYKIYTGDTYVNSGDLWFEVEYATTTLIEFDKATKELSAGLLKFWTINGAIAQTFYTSAGDGYGRCLNAVWATCRDGNANNGIDHLLDYSNAPFMQKGANYVIHRAFAPFDIPVLYGNMATTATLYLHGDGTTYDNNDQYVNICTSSQADITEVVANDFLLSDPDYCNSNKLSDDDIDITAWASDYNEFDLNDLGMSYISSSTELKIMVRIESDIENSPTASGADGVSYYTLERSGTSEDPYLIITMTATSSPPDGDPATTTSVQVPCEMVINNDLSSIVGCMNIYTDSTTTPSEVRQWILHIPFFIWFILLVPSLWLANRIIIELSIRMRH